MKSRAVTDALAFLLPGSHGCAALRDREVKFVEALQGCGLELHTKSNATIIYDNCPGFRNLRYKLKHSRGGTQAEKSFGACTIVTAVAALHTFGEGDNRRCLQNTLKMGPKYDTRIDDMDVLCSSHLLLEEPIPQLDDISEMRALEAEYEGYCDDLDLSPVNIHDDEAAESECGDSDSSAYRNPHFKYCEACGCPWSLNKKSCIGSKRKDLGCGAKLPTAKQYKAKRDKPHESESSSVFAEVKRNIRFGEKKIVCTATHISTNPSVNDEPDSTESSSARSSYEYEVLGAWPENPSSIDSITRILTYIGVMAKLRGYEVY